MLQSHSCLRASRSYTYIIHVHSSSKSRMHAHARAVRFFKFVWFAMGKIFSKYYVNTFKFKKMIKQEKEKSSLGNSLNSLWISKVVCGPRYKQTLTLNPNP